MSDEAKRVLGRFMRADAIGNVNDILAAWKAQIAHFVVLDLELPKFISARASLPTDKKWKEFTPDEQLQWRYVESKKYDYQHFAKFSYQRLLRIGLRELFLALLQQYDLVPVARKKIERYSKLYAKESARNPKNLDEAIALFKTLVSQYVEQYASTKLIASTAKLRGTDVDGVKVLDAGPFKVVNTGGFDQATMDKVARVVEQAAKLLQAKGLGKVCYGEVLVSQRISKSRTLAFYLLQKDEMFIRADLKGHEKDALKTVLHELGHRLHHKFLKSHDLAIGSMYYKIKSGQDALERQGISEAMADPNKRPKPGDTLVDNKKRTFVVEKLDISMRGYSVKMHLAEDNKRKFTVSLKAFLAMKGVKPDVPKAHGFITQYAGTDDAENFAEMIAYYCMNELPDDQVAMLLPIVS
jgi:hypothetical protein